MKLLKKNDFANANEVNIPVGQFVLKGNLIVPHQAQGFVLFAHGSGSSRKSPRNQFVANTLNQEKLGTLLFDLLTTEEEGTQFSQLRFNIPLLSERLVSVIDWIKKEAPGLKYGIFGASTGAAAALVAAAKRPNEIYAVVSRGGRPDLADPFLSNVLAPTLLIVGERDEIVISLNKEALSKIPAEKRLIIISNATHLFEEPGALEEVAHEAKRWFSFFLSQKEEPLFLDRS